MKRRWIVLTSLALALGCQHNHEAKEAKEDEGDEVKMNIADVPAPVRETLTREAGGAKITSVDREMKNGKTIYETDVMSGGQNWEIKVDEAGNLVSKKAEKD